jgi:hypothetical protein
MTGDFFRSLKGVPCAEKRVVLLEASLRSEPDGWPDVEHLTDPLERALYHLYWSRRRDPDWPARFVAEARRREGDAAADEYQSILNRFITT